MAMNAPVVPPPTLPVHFLRKRPDKVSGATAHSSSQSINLPSSNVVPPTQPIETACSAGSGSTFRAVDAHGGVDVINDSDGSVFGLVDEDEEWDAQGGPWTRSNDSPRPKRKLGAAIRLNVSMVALALSTELRAARGAAAAVAGRVLSRLPSGGEADSGTTRSPPLSKPPPFLSVSDDSYDLSNEDAPYDEEKEGCEYVDAGVASPVNAVTVTPTTTTSPGSKHKQHNGSHKKKQRQARAAKQKDGAVQGVKGSWIKVIQRVQAIWLKVDLGLTRSTHRAGPPGSVTFPATSTGFTGQYIPPSPTDRVFTPRELYEQGIQVLEWDGREPRALVDSKSRVFMMLVGSPKDESGWLHVRWAAERQMRLLGRLFKFPGSVKSSRRGNYRSVTCGILFGGGQTVRDARLAY
ncbi:hypothetical protein LXA43DRAFT_1068575 [Ganoderma leucocontextum]|nr:hypothetical protein LXA43DRAFT_1068575 [Ganoderma leucocontextum]